MVKEMVADTKKKRRRFYLPFIDLPIPLFELTCWECGNSIKWGKDERGYYLEEANKISFDPPLEGTARLVYKQDKDERAKHL